MKQMQQEAKDAISAKLAELKKDHALKDKAFKENLDRLKNLRQQAQEAEGRILRALPELDSTLEFLSDRLPEEDWAARVPPLVGVGALEKFEAVAAALPALRAAFREVDGQSQNLRQEMWKCWLLCIPQEVICRR